MSRQELETKVAQQQAEIDRLSALVSSKTSKGRQQAAAAIELLSKGPVSTVELAAINPKYPSDPVYFARTILKAKVKTQRKKGQPTTYALVVDAAPAAEPVVEQPKAEEVAA